LYYLILIRKIKATEILCSFVPKEQIPKYPSSMQCNFFHAFNCTEEVIKISISYLKRSERTSRQRATETATALPQSPSAISKQQQQEKGPLSRGAQGVAASHSQAPALGRKLKGRHLRHWASEAIM